MNNITKASSTEKKGTATKMASEKSPLKKAAASSSPRKAAPRGNVGAGMPAGRPAVSAEERERMIAQAAYLRAEQRGFTGGDPVDDWLAAEREIDTMLSQSSH